MKRTAWILLILLLLTLCSGCGRNRPGRAEPTQPAETGAPASAGTFGVATDWSVYAPRRAEAPRYTRLRPERIPALEPGSYGPLLPFYGDPLYSVDELGYSYLNGYLMGFATMDGTVVCDPVYLDVHTVLCTDGETGDDIPVWVMGRAEEIGIPAGEEWYGPLYDTFYSVAALDGSFVLDGDFAWVTGIRDGFLCCCKDFAYEVYDLDGTLRFTTRELPGTAERYVSLSWIEDGFAYSVDGGDGGEFAVYLLDGQGRIVRGPLEDLGSGVDGLIPAAEEPERYGYLDPAGNWAIPPQFAMAQSFQSRGYAAVTLADGSAAIIDRDGQICFSAQGYSLYGLPNGNFELLEEELWTSTIVDPFGNQLLPGEGWSCVGGDLYVRGLYSDETAVELYDLSTGKTLRVERADYLSLLEPGVWSRVSYRGQPCCVTVGWLDGGEENVVTFINEALEIVGTERNCSVGLETDQVTGRGLTLFWQHDAASRTGVWEDGTPLPWSIPQGNSLKLVNGCVIQADGRICTIRDGAGQVIFRYPMMGAWDD